MIKDLGAFLEEYIRLIDTENRLNKERTRTIRLRHKMEREYFKHYTYEDQIDLTRKAAIYLCWKEEKNK